MSKTQQDKKDNKEETGFFDPHPADKFNFLIGLTEGAVHEPRRFGLNDVKIPLKNTPR